MIVPNRRTPILPPYVLLGLMLCAFVGASSTLHADTPAITPQQAEFFENRVRPVLVEHCISCHGPQKQEGGLRLDSRAAVIKGSDSGEIVEPGKPDDSLLIEAIQQTGSVKMPPKSKLSPEAIASLSDWVKQGLPWPTATTAHSAADAAKNHWAFQPVRDSPPPAVKNTGWPKKPVDQFILAKLEGRGISPSAQADRRTLIRRATFDLIGLPPTPEEVAAFEADPSPAAFETVVERLLASQHYGERWGRHWLDVARYADSKGYVFFEEQKFPWAYTYRDYVVRSLNEDLPYDQFITQQLAADQLDLGTDRRPLAAMGFLTLGGHFMNNVHDILDDRIDVVTRGVLGLTVTCARCHDHKYDPIPQADYYSLYGVFRSSSEPLLPPLFQTPPDTDEYRKFDAEMHARLKKLDDFVQAKHKELVTSARARVGEYILQAHATKDQPSTEGFMLLINPGDLHPTVVMRWWVHLDKTRRRHDPVWSLWHKFAALPSAEFVAKSAELCQQLQARTKEQSQAEPYNPLILAVLLEKPPQSINDVAERLAKLLHETEAQWQQELKKAVDAKQNPPAQLADPAREELRQVLYGPEAPPNVPLIGGWGYLTLLPDRPAQAEYQKVLKEVEQWSMTGPGAPPRAMVLNDLPEPYDPKIFVRGNATRPGATVPRQMLRVLAPEPRPFARGSGRLELAKAIVDPANPLTARVIVNRVWSQHFGAGLVRTPSDFGLRSEPPSHPELLDWLAHKFVKEGWSLKKLHREILLSATWQQSGLSDSPQAAQLDPENRLLSHIPPRRLDFETTRDALLAVAGTLDKTIGGPAVELPGSNRRTIYGYIDRLNVQALLRTFDVPSPDATSPQRDVTTVPAQALYLMNGPFAQQCAQKLTERPEIASEPDFARRLGKVYQLVYSRLPTAEEQTLAEEYFGPDPAQRLAPDRWHRFAHALLLTNEFAFVD